MKQYMITITLIPILTQKNYLCIYLNENESLIKLDT